MINRVRLVGAVPRLVPLKVVDGEWRLDLLRLEPTVSERTRVVFVDNASFPSGWVARENEWDAIASICRARNIWLLYGAGFEGILFDGRTMVRFAFDELNLRRVVATTWYDNAASAAVMRRIGMTIQHNPWPTPSWFQVGGVLEI